MAQTPQRTYAILTKYTTLRSFQEQAGHFSPLEYENAGVYTSALLDAYMDYKNIWKNIQMTSFEVDNGRGTLLPAAAAADSALLPKPVKSGDVVEPFHPNLIGLDEARQACRFQMICKTLVHHYMLSTLLIHSSHCEGSRRSHQESRLSS